MIMIIDNMIRIVENDNDTIDNGIDNDNSNI